MSNVLASGTSVLVVGLAVVFAVLIIIMVVTTILGALMKNVKDSAPAKATQAPAAAPAPAKAREFVPGFDTEDGELVAVIAASISAYLNTESGNLKIRSIRKVN